MIDTHTQSQFCSDGSGNGEGYVFESLFEQTEPAGAGTREQAAGFNSRCQPQPAAADGSEVQQRGDDGRLPGQICGGRQANGESEELGQPLPYLVSAASLHG